MNLALLVLLATGVISKLDFNPPADEPIMVNHKNCPIWVVHILYFIDGKYYFYICLLFNLIKNCCLIKKVLIFWQIFKAKRIEYILQWNLKSVKRPFCCTVSILQVYFTFLCYITFWALENHFIENLKLILKENQIMK